MVKLTDSIKLKFMILVLRSFNIILYNIFNVASDDTIKKQKQIMPEITEFLNDLRN